MGYRYTGELGPAHNGCKRHVIELLQANPAMTGEQLFNLFYQEARAKGWGWRLAWAGRNRGYFDRLADPKLADDNTDLLKGQAV